MDPLDQDAGARENFQKQVGGMIKDIMEDGMGGFVRDVAEKTLQRLADQLLSFTLRGERYLCLNIVSHLGWTSLRE